MLLDWVYRITEVNDAICKMSGFGREEMIGKTPLPFSPDKYKDFLRENRKGLFSGETDEFECMLVTKKGPPIPVLVHSNLLRDDSGQIIGKMAFITDLTTQKKSLVLVKIDPIGKRLRWVKAGHEPAMVYDPGDDRFTELKGNGMALGISEKYEYKENSYTGLKCGQVIVIGTDGIWEALDKSGRMYGKKRFQRIIRENVHRDATDIIDAIFESLNIFTAGRQQNDDITLVVIKLTKELGAIENWVI